MDENELKQRMENLKEKLHKSMRQVAALKEKGKYLAMQYDDSRLREKNNNDLVMELLERQRELNVMLNRANIMLNRTQEAMALTSMEFNEMAKALPEPKKAEWSDRVAKINDLFKKTGIQDADVVGLDNPTPALSESLTTDELRRESEEMFRKNESLWNRAVKPEPPRVEAVIVEEEVDHGDDHADPGDEDEDLIVARKKSWWQRVAG